jgi:hypothetical protein
MPNKGRNYTGTFRTKPDAIFLTNKRQLVTTVTQTRTNVGYFRSYLAGLPNSDIDDPFCSCPRRVHQTIRHLLTECPLYSKERATMDSRNARLERRGFSQCSTLATEHQP